MAPPAGLLLVFFISLSGIINPAHGAKIISVTFFSSVRHKLMFQPLLEELGKRGHEVTVLTPIKTTKPMKNVKEILTIDSEALQDEFLKKNNITINPFGKEDKGKNIFTHRPTINRELLDDLCRDTYDLPQVKDFLKEEFDLIFFQPVRMNECALGLVHKLNAPVIVFSPSGINNYIVGKVGGHFPPSFLPYEVLGFKGDMNFYQRFISFGAYAVLPFVMRIVIELSDWESIYRERLGQDTPSVDEILGNASLVLSNSHFSFDPPMPLFPDVVEVGGMHCRPAEPLPKELDDFVGGAKEGLIYFSLGGTINGSTMPEEKRKIFRNVFAKLEQRVLWKWETETMADLPPNVMLREWVPQQDVLGHENTKIFLTHWGGLSRKEAIYHGVPLIGFRVFDKDGELAKKNCSFCIELDWNELTEEQLSSAIQEILNNPAYRDKVKALSFRYRDQPDTPLDRAVFWVEYVMRHNGATHLRSDGRKLNWVQYHSYDVFLAYVVIISTIFYLWFAIVRFIVCKVCCRSKKKTVSKKSKKA